MNALSNNVKWMGALIVAGVLAVPLLVSLVWGQVAAQPHCNIIELYNREGWEIPGIRNVRLKERITNITADNEEVSVEVLQPIDRVAWLPLISYVPKYPGRIELREQPINVIEIRRYSIKERIFAYRVSAEQVAAEGKRRIAIASAEVVMFYDIDGNGRFTIREYATNIPYKLKVPHWITNE